MEQSLLQQMAPPALAEAGSLGWVGRQMQRAQETAQAAALGLQAPRPAQALAVSY
jgi:hypothetical protein